MLKPSSPALIRLAVLAVIGLGTIALTGCGKPQPVVSAASIPTPFPPAPTEAPYVAVIPALPPTPAPGQAAQLGRMTEQFAKVAGVNVANGARLYAAGCAGCHGSTGEGGSASSLHLNRIVQRADDKTLGNILLKGIPNTRMPAWLGTLSESEVADLVGLLRSWQTLSSTTTRTVTGNPANGARLFAAGCGSCHGQQGEGASASILRRNDFIKTNSDQVLRDVIQKGIPSVGMPAWEQSLTENEIQDVIALLRRWQVSGPSLGQGDLANGEVQYDKAGCASCHGASGRGGLARGLLNNDFVRVNDDASLRKVLLEGLPQVGMPAWLGKASETDVEDLIALLRSWQPAPAPVPTAAPQAATGRTGNATNGQATYNAECSVCHGAKGQGGLGPALVGTKTEDTKLQTLIERGVPGTAMPGYGGKLKPEQIKELIAFIRSGLGR